MIFTPQNDKMTKQTKRQRHIIFTYSPLESQRLRTRLSLIMKRYVIDLDSQIYIYIYVLSKSIIPTVSRFAYLCFVLLLLCCLLCKLGVVVRLRALLVFMIVISSGIGVGYGLVLPCCYCIMCCLCFLYRLALFLALYFVFGFVLLYSSSCLFLSCLVKLKLETIGQEKILDKTHGCFVLMQMPMCLPLCVCQCTWHLFITIPFSSIFSELLCVCVCLCVSLLF